MNPRSLAGPILAFASAAVMLGVIAGLAAFLISGDTLSGEDDFIIGEGVGGPVPTITGKPLADFYPFIRYFRLPDGSKEANITTNPPRRDWYGQFVLPDPSTDTLSELRRQAESNGLKTNEIRDSNGGFTFSGSEIDGSVVLFRFTRDSHVLVINLTRHP